ncbi:kinase interacting family protein [Raphanus sativus]|uniref:Protein NETWORKED 2A-like n=1 Tax=Raphanus sativus TaxID=3726 RepID=A0A6J0LLY7_RAPSA|nr:protein NETWORKED 2A-like [Raphanus sativus]XP_056857308.1 protein NETWORKED 2A-like [Raphanus sativus]KAJ4866176.1 kinase interacting family protein [Raphanus sativus]KAJ4866691.1 kinase interacting family protein [Raphanus sativus]
MLQRAASNAYSWWWASHIRTKQSKWLEHNLQDMEEKVEYTLKIIDEDGDTFAKRADMYYRKRPEIVSFVEEAFRSYRALAERYDHLSRELQSANRTIATAFPEHVQFPLEDDDVDVDVDVDEGNPRKQPHLHLVPKGGNNIPQVPEFPIKEFRSQSMMLSRKGPDSLKRTVSSALAKREAAVVSSGLSKEEGLEEIDSLQKGILALQTEKEFVRSSYEQSYERYWDLDNEVTEMQKRVCSLQDEFGLGAGIDDSEARTLMATTALSSCKDTLAKLEEKRKQSVEEAEIEKERITTAKERFNALRNKFEKPKSDDDHDEFIKTEAEEDVAQESSYESEREDSNENLTVVKLAEKIDDLVQKIVSLESNASSHNALVKTLRSETDGLHEHIRGLEEDKASLISDSTDMKQRMTSLENELREVRKLYQKVEDQNKSLQKQFKEANWTADDLSGKLQDVKMDEDVEGSGIFHEMPLVSGSEDCLKSISKEMERESNVEDRKTHAIVVKESEGAQEERPETKDSFALSETASTGFGTEDEDEETPNWRQLLPDGMEDREKVLLDDYTSVLRDYRGVKRKLSEVEKKNREGFFELALQLRELKNAVAYKDVEIQSLRQKLGTLEKDSPHQGEGNNQLEHDQGQRESMNVSPTSNFSVSTTPHHQVGEAKRIESNEVRVKFAEDDDDSPRTNIPAVEDKVRADIDAVLEENLEFWLRFSSSVHQIQKYQTTVQDLKSELTKLRIESRQQQESSRSSSSKHAAASDAKPIYRHLREIRTELQLWLENSAVLKDELQGRFGSLANIQEEIARVTAHSGGSKVSDSEISGYQAAKFHGEIVNMKQENKRVSSELQSGVDRVRVLKTDVERILSKLEEDIGISSAAEARTTPSKSSSSGKARIPLRSFLFGVKLKKQTKQKQASASLFSCVSPFPALQQQSSYVKPGKLPE